MIISLAEVKSRDVQQTEYHNVITRLHHAVGKSTYRCFNFV